MRNRKSKLALIGMSALVVAGSIVGLSTPAYANSAQCVSGKMCLWLNSGYSDAGNPAGFYQSSSTSDAVLNSTISAQSSSSWNRQAVRVAIWSGSNFSGTATNLAANQQNIDLGTIGWNDKIRSWKQN